MLLLAAGSSRWALILELLSFGRKHKQAPLEFLFGTSTSLAASFGREAREKVQPAGEVGELCPAKEMRDLTDGERSRLGRRCGDAKQGGEE